MNNKNKKRLKDIYSVYSCPKCHKKDYYIDKEILRCIKCNTKIAEISNIISNSKYSKISKIVISGNDLGKSHWKKPQGSLE